ncbi:MAG: sodium/proton-translocating pyrophosphatase, partial [Clostridiales bacterium]|nr:sodium/proton-translocating pyrophosphatase [Clostridiales bacterium]
MSAFMFELFALIVSFIALGVAAWLFRWVKSQPLENERIAEIGEYIRRGANVFLRREYTVLARFVAVAALLIMVFLPKPIWEGNISKNILITVSYIFGTGLSALSGKIGIMVSTIANTKAAEAARHGIKPSFMTGFRGGAVMGMAVVGTSLLGVTII